jgi:diadenosine tetraphosphate (Ap4A) HIT family hydrolase
MGTRIDRMVAADGCLLCDVDRADEVFDRVRVWEDGRWRLSVVRRGPVAGFAHLEPHRHIPYVTDLDGEEATTFGPVLARVTAALREATGAELTYAYVFGERVPHLHVNLAPHSAGDALVGGPGLVRPDAAPVPREAHEAVAAGVRDALA